MRISARNKPLRSIYNQSDTPARSGSDNPTVERGGDDVGEVIQRGVIHQPFVLSLSAPGAEV
jgi:hypothetical protein